MKSRTVKANRGKSSKVYDSKGRIARQIVDGSPIDYEYTKYGLLAGKHLGGKLNPDALVIYEYSKSGQIVARTANGVRQTYEYDKKGQLLAVKDAEGNALERYAYDKAGNMLKKTVNGKTTTFAFDAANQLASSTTDGVTTRYTYDAAGRLVKEGAKTYRYGYLDKVLSVTDGDMTRTFAYHADGQLASANYGDTSESFAWDGLALIQRGDEQFVNEPHVGGGNPVASSKGTSYFNDMLGTTVGSKSNGKYSAAALTAFGEDLTVHSPTPTQNSNFFTGKPFVEGLGHAFLMRNYRAGLAKWQTSDPMGYPDGWNQLVHCNNGVTSAVDLWGCEVFDDAWELIFGHWMVGGGVELDLFYDEYFTSYMASNMLLRDQIEQWLMNFARGHESGRINLTRHAEIENGYLTGYELLHGTNATVGDFQIVGNYTSAIDGKWKYYFFNVELTWNDIIDPNYSLFGDNVLAFIFKRYPGANPADYLIRIRWDQLFILREAYE